MKQILPLHNNLYTVLNVSLDVFEDSIDEYFYLSNSESALMPGVLGPFGQMPE